MIRTVPSFIALCLMLYACSAPPPKDDGQVDTDQEGPLCPDLSNEPVQIETIAAAYAANEAAAQRDFGGRCLFVSGTVEDVRLDFMDEPVIELAGETANDASIRLAETAFASAADLTKGQKALFLCQEVNEFLGSPSLSDCYIVNSAEQSAP